MLSIPVADGENNGFVRAVGRLLSDGVDRNLTVKINGSATGVTMDVVGTANGTSAVAFTAIVGDTGTGMAVFELTMMTAKTGANLKRHGLLRVGVQTSAGARFGTYVASFAYSGAAVITSIELDCGNATGLIAGSEAFVEERASG